jgi:hypothetical protein
MLNCAINNETGGSVNFLPVSRQNPIFGGYGTVVTDTLPLFDQESQNVKKCRKCGEEKPATTEFFHANKGGKYGLRAVCILCWRAYTRELIKRPETAEKRKKYAAEYGKSGRRAKAQREWRKKNPVSAKASAVKWKSKNKDHIRETALKCRERNREAYRAKQRRADAKLQTQPYHVIKKRLKARLRQMLKGTVLGSTEKLFGFTRGELLRHIESKFTDGMSWEALVRGEIHIDHKRPVSSFNITSINDPDFKICWSLDNLQPLWAKDNYLKGAKVND